MQIITISRQTASGGEEIAAELANRLGLKLIDRNFVLENWLPEVADEHQLHMLEQSSKFYTKILNPDAEKKEQLSFADYIAQRLKKEAEKNNLLILGLGAQIIFKKHPYTLHFKIVASEEYRVNELKQKYGLHQEEAARELELADRKHRRYVWRIHKQDWEETTLYHLTLNRDGLNLEESLSVLMTLVDLKKENPKPLEDNIDIKSENIESESQRNFGHESEKEFAKILDMHHIKWEYEPSEFPLEWDPEGNVVMAFRPDFYLTEHDTYVELTTMKRKYTTEKNKKVRLLQQLYPHIKIKIVYKKDFEQLADKFELNGSED
ncbi:MULTISPECIES: cytidylate kinase family protein [Halanaerobium]|jgi:cytidylate kinase|uniref:Cytidylate kinase n=1 Tax=Halanaerobium kushneri TaxID=56779 RepID=A0A1N6WVF4_9FIRM|nr:MULTISPECIES: cytidylate kinase family protein [Halanaerobium]RCW62448.1 cytidylate kinase [Halanaerobium sp. ST460_2HS_T2]SIQ93981.1 Cytidylate kinase [Halanaerobium kushneri]